jgi:hypothetical protein
MMLKCPQVSCQLVNLVRDGLLNSKRIPIASVQDILAKTKTRIDQVPSLECMPFIETVIRKTKEDLYDVLYQFRLVNSVADEPVQLPDLD